MNGKELKKYLKLSRVSAPTQVASKQTYELKNLSKVLNNSEKSLKYLKTQLAVTTMMAMIATKSRLHDMTY